MNAKSEMQVAVIGPGYVVNLDVETARERIKAGIIVRKLNGDFDDFWAADDASYNDVLYGRNK
jgi:hypothetical protein